jgi:TolA-binding protein
MGKSKSPAKKKPQAERDHAREEAAAVQLRFAKDFADGIDKKEAIARLEEILKKFPETEAAKEARSVLAKLKGGPSTVPADAEKLAASKLKQARALFDDGKAADARDYCNDILKKYPDTKAAEEAKSLLKQMEVVK